MRHLQLWRLEHSRTQNHLLRRSHIQRAASRHIRIDDPGSSHTVRALLQEHLLHHRHRLDCQVWAVANWFVIAIIRRNSVLVLAEHQRLLLRSDIVAQIQLPHYWCVCSTQRFDESSRDVVYVVGVRKCARSVCRICGGIEGLERRSVVRNE